MTAGKPDYNRLMELGKLPKDARGNIPYLAQLDKAEKRIEELEAEVLRLKGEGSQEVMIQCEVELCEFVAKGSQGQAENRLRLHGRTHEVKEKKEVELQNS